MYLPNFVGTVFGGDGFLANETCSPLQTCAATKATSRLASDARVACHFGRAGRETTRSGRPFSPCLCSRRSASTRFRTSRLTKSRNKNGSGPMSRELVAHNKPVFDHLHPRVYAGAVGLVA